MMTPTEYLRHDATALAALVDRGEVTAAELLSTALARTERINPRINAVIHLMREQAEQQLRTPLKGPLAGVPMLIKDFGQDYASVPTAMGSRALRNNIPARHSAIVRRLLESGALIFGKTNTPELALKAVTDPRAFGITRNPWDLERVPGGSSGGSAAAVAAGIVPMAGANDGGGSIRIPAACCGLFGLRPSRGRVSMGPAMSDSMDGASSDLVVSRSVRDSALALDVLSGAEPGDPFVIAPPPQSFRSLAQMPPGRLRIAWSTVSPIDTPVDAEARQAVHDTVRLLTDLGHQLEEDAPVYDGADLARCYLHMYFGAVAAGVAEARAIGARASDFELLTRVLDVLGRSLSAGQYVRSRQGWNKFARALGDFHARHDLFLTPTLACPPARHGEVDPPRWQQAALSLLLRSGVLSPIARLGLLDGTVDQLARDNLRYVPFTQLANLTGTPAMSVPLYWTGNGLPLGVQFIGPFGSEARLLQLAGQLEQARPWFARLPALALSD